MSFTAPVTQVGPGTPAGIVLRRHWHPVAVASDLAAGTARPARLLGEDLTLYRDESGVAHVVGGRCAHRGTSLHTGWVEGDCIRCIYHGWSFDSSGQCIDQPAEQPGFAQAAKIASHVVEEYAGLIFVHLGEAPAPPLPRFPELDQPGIVAVPGVRPPGPWPLNYFQALENNVDPVHLSFVHRESEPFTRQVPQVAAERTTNGIAMTATRGGVARQTHYWFPTMIQLPLYLIPGERTQFQFFNWVVPVDDGHTMFVAATAVPEELMGRIRNDIAGRTMEPGAAQELMAGARRPSSVTEEDYVAMVGQGQFADRHNERLGRSDVGIVEMRRMWVEAMQDSTS